MGRMVPFDVTVSVHSNMAMRENKAKTGPVLSLYLTPNICKPPFFSRVIYTYGLEKKGNQPLGGRDRGGGGEEKRRRKRKKSLI